MRVATIGVYGFTAEEFLGALREADVRLVLDMRQRRGVRGPEYAWANAKRLQAALEEAGIEYEHIHCSPRPRPSSAAPVRRGRPQGRRESAREPSWRPAYVSATPTEILASADLGRPRRLRCPAEGASALFCVERDPEACHRSLVADRLATEHGSKRRAPSPRRLGGARSVRRRLRSRFSGTNLLAMNVAPCGSAITAIRTQGASNGGTSTVPPSSVGLRGDRVGVVDRERHAPVRRRVGLVGRDRVERRHHVLEAARGAHLLHALAKARA